MTKGKTKRKVKRKRKSKWEGKKCSIRSCTNDAKILDKCRNCYQAEIRWAKRKPMDRMRRRAKLALFSERLAELVPPDDVEVEEVEEEEPQIIKHKGFKGESRKGKVSSSGKVDARVQRAGEYRQGRN